MDQIGCAPSHCLISHVVCNLGTKYHYLRHCVEYWRIWSLSIGYNSKQSIENYHKTCSMVFRRYRNQRGLLRINNAMIPHTRVDCMYIVCGFVDKYWSQSPLIDVRIIS